MGLKNSKKFQNMQNNGIILTIPSQPLYNDFGQAAIERLDDSFIKETLRFLDEGPNSPARQAAAARVAALNLSVPIYGEELTDRATYETMLAAKHLQDKRATMFLALDIETVGGNMGKLQQTPIEISLSFCKYTDEARVTTKAAQPTLNMTFLRKPSKEKMVYMEEIITAADKAKKQGITSWSAFMDSMSTGKMKITNDDFRMLQTLMQYSNDRFTTQNGYLVKGPNIDKVITDLDVFAHIEDAMKGYEFLRDNGLSAAEINAKTRQLLKAASKNDASGYGHWYNKARGAVTNNMPAVMVVTQSGSLFDNPIMRDLFVASGNKVNTIGNLYENSFSWDTLAADKIIRPGFPDVQLNPLETIRQLNTQYKGYIKPSTSMRGKGYIPHYSEHDVAAMREIFIEQLGYIDNVSKGIGKGRMPVDADTIIRSYGAWARTPESDEQVIRYVRDKQTGQLTRAGRDESYTLSSFKEYKIINAWKKKESGQEFLYTVFEDSANNSLAVVRRGGKGHEAATALQRTVDSIGAWNDKPISFAEKRSKDYFKAVSDWDKMFKSPNIMESLAKEGGVEAYLQNPDKYLNRERIGKYGGARLRQYQELFTAVQQGIEERESKMGNQDLFDKKLGNYRKSVWDNLREYINAMSGERSISFPKNERRITVHVSGQDAILDVSNANAAKKSIRNLISNPTGAQAITSTADIKLNTRNLMKNLNSSELLTSKQMAHINKIISKNIPNTKGTDVSLIDPIAQEIYQAIKPQLDKYYNTKYNTPQEKAAAFAERGIITKTNTTSLGKHAGYKTEMTGKYVAGFWDWLESIPLMKARGDSRTLEGLGMNVFNLYNERSSKYKSRVIQNVDIKLSGIHESLWNLDNPRYDGLVDKIHQRGAAIQMYEQKITTDSGRIANNIVLAISRDNSISHQTVKQIAGRNDVLKFVIPMMDEFGIYTTYKANPGLIPKGERKYTQRVGTMSLIGFDDPKTPLKLSDPVRQGLFGLNNNINQVLDLLYSNNIERAEQLGQGKINKLFNELTSTYNVGFDVGSGKSMVHNIGADGGILHARDLMNINRIEATHAAKKVMDRIDGGKGKRWDQMTGTQKAAFMYGMQGYTVDSAQKQLKLSEGALKYTQGGLDLRQQMIDMKLISKGGSGPDVNFVNVKDVQLDKRLYFNLGNGSDMYSFGRYYAPSRSSIAGYHNAHIMKRNVVDDVARKNDFVLARSMWEAGRIREGADPTHMATRYAGMTPQQFDGIISHLDDATREAIYQSMASVEDGSMILSETMAKDLARSADLPDDMITINARGERTLRQGTKMHLKEWKGTLSAILPDNIVKAIAGGDAGMIFDAATGFKGQSTLINDAINQLLTVGKANGLKVREMVPAISQALAGNKGISFSKDGIVTVADHLEIKSTGKIGMLEIHEKITDAVKGVARKHKVKDVDTIFNLYRSGPGGVRFMVGVGEVGLPLVNTGVNIWGETIEGGGAKAARGFADKGIKGDWRMLSFLRNRSDMGTRYNKSYRGSATYKSLEDAIRGANPESTFEMMRNIVGAARMTALTEEGTNLADFKKIGTSLADSPTEISINSIKQLTFNKQTGRVDLSKTAGTILDEKFYKDGLLYIKLPDTVPIGGGKQTDKIFLPNLAGVTKEMEKRRKKLGHSQDSEYYLNELIKMEDSFITDMQSWAYNLNKGDAHEATKALERITGTSQTGLKMRDMNQRGSIHRYILALSNEAYAKGGFVAERFAPGLGPGVRGRSHMSNNLFEVKRQMGFVDKLLESGAKAQDLFKSGQDITQYSRMNIGDFTDMLMSQNYSKISKMSQYFGTTEKTIKDMLAAEEALGSNKNAKPNVKRQLINDIIEKMTVQRDTAGREYVGKGFSAFETRYPLTGSGSIRQVMVALDPRLDRGQVAASPGAFKAMGGDFDGDEIQLMFNSLFGKSDDVIKLANEGAAFAERISRSTAKGTREWISKYTNKAGQLNMDDIVNILATKNSNVLGFDNELGDLLTMYARTGKSSTGILSNLHTRLRTRAEVVEDALGKKGYWDIFNKVGEALETGSIDAKHILDTFNETMEISMQGGAMTYQEAYTEATKGLQAKFGELEQLMLDTQNPLGLDKKGLSTVGAYQKDEIINQEVYKRWLPNAQKFGILKGAEEREYREFFIKNQELQYIFANPENGVSNIFLQRPTKDQEVAIRRIISSENQWNLLDIDPFIRHILEGGSIDEAGKYQSANVHQLLQETHNAMEKSGGRGQTYIDPDPSRTIRGATLEEAAQRITRTTANMNMNKIALAGAVAVGAAAMLGGAGPRPEREPQQGRHNQAPSSDGQYLDPAIWQGGPPGTAPKAYLQQKGRGYERVNMNISGKSNTQYTNEQISQLISDEIMFQSPMDLNISIYSKDDRQGLDKHWLRNEMLRALAH